MVVEAFPPVDAADDNGFLCVGGDLEVPSLLLAYRSGIFPWPISREYPITWFAPKKRAVLFLNDLHLSASLKKEVKRNRFQFRIDSNFRAVIEACAEEREMTWITPEMVEAYTAFHHAGYAHSVEGFFQGELVGGLYGVSIQGMYAGESMFHRVSNVSKLALVFLIEYLQERGVEWIDCQQLTPLFKSLGAVEVWREEFLVMLREALAREVKLF